MAVAVAAAVADPLSHLLLAGQTKITLYAFGFGRLSRRFVVDASAAAIIVVVVAVVIFVL